MTKPLVLLPCSGDMADLDPLESLLKDHQVTVGHLVSGAAGEETSGSAHCAVCAEARERGAGQTACEDLRGRVFAEAVSWLLRAALPEEASSPVWQAGEDAVLASRMTRLARKLDVAEVAIPSDWSSRREGALARALSVPVRRVADGPTGLQVHTSLWGSVARGGALEDEDGLPEEATPDLPSPEEADELPEEFTLELQAGQTRSLFGQELDGASLFRQLGAVACRHGVGRGLWHVAGGPRLVCSSPAASLLLTARRALERAVLEPRRLRAKDALARQYVDLVLGGEHAAPLARDCEAFLASALGEVSGEVTVQLYRGTVEVLGVSAGG